MILVASNFMLNIVDSIDEVFYMYKYVYRSSFSLVQRTNDTQLFKIDQVLTWRQATPLMNHHYGNDHLIYSKFKQTFWNQNGL